MWKAEDASLSQQTFVGECLKSLRLALNNLGITLHISSISILETLTFIAQQQAIAEIHSHEETGNLTSYAIDQSVAKWCKTYHVKWHQYPQNGVVRALKIVMRGMLNGKVICVLRSLPYRHHTISTL